MGNRACTQTGAYRTTKIGNVVVVGSLTMDFTAGARRMPGRGETVLGTSFTMVPGGKGNNQAVAAAHLGAHVTMIGCVGDDVLGEEVRMASAAEGVDMSRLAVAKGPTGVAHIAVDNAGDNRIIMVPLANESLTTAAIRRNADVICAADVLLCQLEVPIATVQASLELAKTAGVRTILNPAPAAELTEELLELVDILVPNETELEALSGLPAATQEDARIAASTLLEQGAACVVVTRASDGAIAVTEHLTEFVLPFPVQAVDATAAGDAFCGALAAKLACGSTLQESLNYAAAAGALATTVHGALPSLPASAAVEELVATKGNTWRS
jgi:ribokinase